MHFKSFNNSLLSHLFCKFRNIFGLAIAIIKKTSIFATHFGEKPRGQKKQYKLLKQSKMPTIQQLVRKGRAELIDKSKSPALDS